MSTYVIAGSSSLEMILHY